MRSEQLNFLFSPVTRIRGVGAAMSGSLSKLLPAAAVVAESTVPIIRDLLFHLPSGIVDRRFTCPLNQAPDGVVATFVVTVDEHAPPKQKRFGKQPYKVYCSNETGTITLVFFNARDDYIKNALPIGAKRVISGRTEHFEFQLQMTHPDIIAPVDKLSEVQKPEAVYPLTVGLSSRRIGKMVADIFEKLPELPEWISPEAMKKHAWPSWKEALLLAHHPQSPDDLLPTAPARTRLAYDEMLANQLHLAQMRQHMKVQPGIVIRGTGVFSAVLTEALPFKLTAGQENALREITYDLASGKRMGRLLQGDVGSGKTIVALLSMLCAAEEGLQSAIMVPTELIAQQHYENINKLCKLTGVQVVLLTGSVKGNARKEALARIASGEALIVVGTHALFQEHVEFKNLALIVIDEQHRFGVAQRMALAGKGNQPHILHMTATPIPRSLTMTLYGDMDISTLREKPAERLPITTRLIPLNRLSEIMERLKAALDRGEKAYWICPLIEDASPALAAGSGAMQNQTPPFGGDDDIAAVKSRFTEFKARFGNKVGLVHGRMKAAERNEQMQKFASGEVKLLVATTVVEVGVDVRDATIIVIEQAERFGLAQLHQLRGRVGRGDKPSACVLLHMPNGADDANAKRLSILRETEDGFKIAEADLAQRGGGDLLGTRQSGLPRYIFTDLFVHQALLTEARNEVSAALADDPAQSSEAGKALMVLLGLFDYETVG